MVVGVVVLLDEVNHALDLLLRDKAALGTARALAAKLVEHVAVAKEALGTRLVEDDARVHAIVDRKRHAVVDVCLDEARHDVCRGALRGNDEVYAGSAPQLGDAHNRGLDVLAGNHHEVRELVDHDDEIRHVLWRVLHVSVLVTVNVTVVGLDVADLVVLEDLEAALHLGDAPGEGACCLVWLGHHRHVEVGQAGIVGELDALGVHHDETDLLGCCAHEDGHDDAVEQYRLARARSSCN